MLKTIKNVFEAMIEPFLLYGAEVWEQHEAARKVDEVKINLAKEVLGVRRSIASNGAIGEVRWSKTSPIK